MQVRPVVSFRDKRMFRQGLGSVRDVESSQFLQSHLNLFVFYTSLDLPLNTYIHTKLAIKFLFLFSFPPFFHTHTLYHFIHIEREREE